MENIEFNALVTEEINGKYVSHIKTKNVSSLPEGDLLVKVLWSSLNYKDALSATGNKGVTRQYPHTPGIDAAGEVAWSASPGFNTGDKVVVTSYDLGMNTPGGFGQYIRVPSDWVLKLPDGLSLKESMMFGTAGITAATCCLRLAELVQPGDGDIIVSGATGGVGSLSVAMLARLGYKVIALTGKESEKDYLKQLGASEIILRQDFEQADNRPLLKSVFAGAVDTTGGLILEKIIKSVKQMGAVTCCGNVASAELNLTVFPFILRGITLIGVSTQNLPMNLRKKVWQELAGSLKPAMLSIMCEETDLENLPAYIDLILKGQVKRRTIIRIS